MNLAKVSANGQITVPIEIRRKLNIKEGSKIIFLENANGDIVIKNAFQYAIKEAQDDFRGLNVSEEDILKDVMDVRYPKGE